MELLFLYFTNTQLNSTKGTPGVEGPLESQTFPSIHGGAFRYLVGLGHVPCLHCWGGSPKNMPYNEDKSSNLLIQG